uniref:(northern house mosquito) hypothetical protein n=1 Tax=Culex pipiens TaxID=7175 RepID=A0A8D8GQA0_CULPI
MFRIIPKSVNENGRVCPASPAPRTGGAENQGPQDVHQRGSECGGCHALSKVLVAEPAEFRPVHVHQLERSDLQVRVSELYVSVSEFQVQKLHRQNGLLLHGVGRGGIGGGCAGVGRLLGGEFANQGSIVAG